MSGRIDEFTKRGCEVLGVSTDEIQTHIQWLTSPPSAGGLGPIAFRLAADPDGATCANYGVYVERQRVALRGLFIIDPNSVVQYEVTHSLSVGRSANEVLRVLDALQSGGLCPGERQASEPTIDVMANLQPGRILGPYRIEAELGSGTFGTVFHARDTLLDRPVALKILRDDQEGSRDALLTEARAAAALNHPNVCTVHTVDTSHGVAMIVMEFVVGQTLAEIIDDGPLEPRRVANFSRQIAAGMATAHRAGVVHGDLKPGNLLVTADEGIKIMDFGLARRAVANAVADEGTLPHDANRGLSGTLSYLSPELARGAESTPASDTYALGLILCEMLTGKRVIHGTNIWDALRQIEEFDAAAYVTSLPTEFRVPLQKTLSRVPAERLTMEQLAELSDAK